MRPGPVLRSLAARWPLASLSALGLWLFVVLSALPLPASAQTPGSTFDHVATGYPLTGAHEQVRCETCHIKAIFKGTPRDCNSCHIENNQRGALAKPPRHIQTSDSCDTCHTVAAFTGAIFSHVMVAPGSCATCHNGVRQQGKPANHIATTLSCDRCHGTTAFAPARAFDHSALNGVLTTCATCHDGTKATGQPGNHIATADPTLCGSCHVASTQTGFTSFAGGQMDHTGISSGCANCHGPGVTGGTFAGITSIVVMPPSAPPAPTSHIPSSTTCETCHLASKPSGLVPANTAAPAPGSRFAAPAPTNAQIHTGIASGCNSCHDSNFVWMGVSVYPIAPTVVTSGAQYTGFHTRPLSTAGAFRVADVVHPSSGDCSDCHSSTSSFDAVQSKPANHIPYAAGASCTACHTTPGDFATMPTLANIHANAPSTTNNCAQCHGAAAPSFAIPANNFSVVGLPGNHVPTGLSCETCHVGAGSSIAATPVGNGAKFTNSLMSHSGISNNCAACHGPSITGSSFVGVAKIIVMPATSPPGASSHIPSSTTCETCHLGTVPAGLIAATATANTPGSAFASPAPSTAQIHTGVTSGCSACHDTNFVWMGVNAYPIAPTTLVSGAQYTGFQTRPHAAAGTFSVADASHPASGDCSQCHSGTNFFTAQDKPANHIPTSATAQCSACHTTPGDFATMPTLANIHANAPSTTNNCAQCHGAAAPSFAIPANNFSVVGLPGNHVPTGLSCETCHVGAGSSIAATPVGNGAKFTNSLMSHSGISNNCAACHGPSITGSSFVGVAKIIVMPATSPPGASSHIPSSTTCETCHLGTVPAGLIAATATANTPGSAFASPAPSTAQIHTGVTSGCSACHDTNFVWMGVNAYPIAPTTLVSGAQYTGFQTRPHAAAGTFSVADASHPASGDCSQCHSGTNFFTAQDKPANHIPTSATAQCSACHTTPGDFATMPTLANIHANAPSTTNNCAQCHGAAAPSFAIPANNFSVVGLPGNHVPTGLSCETCHVGAGSSIAATPVGNGAKFTNSLMSHSGISNNCAACHGPSITGSSFVGVAKIIVMPATSPPGASSHIPSSTTCETCHLGTVPAGLIAATATANTPGSAFASPAPSTAQIHTGVTSGCSACHDTNFVWMGVNAYPIAPTTLVSGAQYTGFQTRPHAAAGTFSVADASHPASGDCSQCHSGTNFFTAQDKPANHIPTSATAQCSACHTTPGDFATMPTLANIHANAPSTTNNCAQCHGAAAPSFAIPANNFSVVGLPGNHVPTGLSCETCHVGAGSSIAATPVGNGAKFTNSLMSHSGISNNCAACHGPSITGSSFVGVAKIIVMPATSPPGASSHIPSSTTCETCHLGTVPAGLIAATATANTPGSAFASPAPSTAQIHTGVTSGCSACHDTNFVWMGVNAYPIAPTTLVSGAQYTGFQTRPHAAAGTFSVADASHPASGDCSQCHSGTNFFTGTVKPAGHIPTNLATCSTCHVIPGDFSVAGLTPNNTILHTGIVSNCIACHSAGTGFGPFAGCATQATCASPPPLTYQPKTTPLDPNGSPTTPSALTHIPTVGITCESCHSAAVFTSFAGMNMKGNTTAHTAVGADTCITCHEGTPKYTWFGVNIVTKPVGHEGRKAGQDCVGSGCHRRTYSGFSNEARVRPIQRAAVAGANTRLMPDGTALPPIGASQGFDHRGVLPGQCQTCHNGQAARGLPARHLVTRASCDTCHRNTAWVPAEFSHQGVLPGQCQTCHNGSSASGKSSGHFVTARSCDACHRTIGWVPVNYSHISPLYRSAPDKPICVSCHVTNGEIVPRQMRGGPRPRPSPGQ